MSQEPTAAGNSPAQPITISDVRSVSLWIMGIFMETPFPESPASLQAAFGNNTAVLKQLRTLPFKRAPAFRANRYFNIVPIINWEALFAYIVGEKADDPCNSCKVGNGPFPECVGLEGFLTDRCANCHYMRTNCNDCESPVGLLKRQINAESPCRYWRVDSAEDTLPSVVVWIWRNAGSQSNPTNTSSSQRDFHTGFQILPLVL